MVLLFWLNGVSIHGFVNLFYSTSITFSSYFLALLLSGVGIVLGILFCVLSNQSQKIKKSIYFGISACFPLLMIGAYGVGGVFLVYDLVIWFVKIGLALGVCTVVIIGTFGVLKQQKNIFLSSGVGVLFFFFFTKMLMKDFVSVVDPLDLFLLYFVFYMCCFDLGIQYIFFSKSLENLLHSPHTESLFFKRFNQVMNGYFFQIGITFFIIYLGSSIILQQLSPFFVSFTAGEFMGFTLISSYGMWLLILVVMSCSLVFWYLFPREKP